MLHQIEAQLFYTDFHFYKAGLFLQKIVRFKIFSRLQSSSSVPFKEGSLQESPPYSSTFQACENTD